MANTSTKIKEIIKFEDDMLIVKKTHDASVALKDAQQARELSPNAFASDYKQVGNVDMAMLNNWLKEAGVAWTDTQAVKDVIKRKLMSNEFSGLRVWEGKW
jgi:hypothetical protein